MTEAWVLEDVGTNPQCRATDEVQLLKWGKRTALNTILHGVELFHQPSNARIGWAFCVENNGFLEVEEFFVRPDYRRKQHGTALLNVVQELIQRLGLQMRIWIPHVDASASQLPFLHDFVKRLGLKLSPSPFRWAKMVAESQPTLGAAPTAPPAAMPRQWLPMTEQD